MKTLGRHLGILPTQIEGSNEIAAEPEFVTREGWRKGEQGKRVRAKKAKLCLSSEVSMAFSKPESLKKNTILKNT